MNSLTSRFLALLLVCFSLSACTSAALDPAKFPLRAADANRNESRIEAALETLCAKAGVEFCEKQARVLLENGKPLEAEAVASKACQAGKNSACSLAGEILLAQGKIPEASRLLTGACESASQKDGIACTGAGEAALLSDDRAGSLRLWKRGCQLGNVASCYYVGKTHRLANRISESLPPLTRACTAGVLGSCTEAGISLMLSGKSEGALEKFAADCEHRSMRACRWLPLLLDKSKNSALEKTLESDCRKNHSLEACYDSTVLQFLRPGGRTLALYRWKQNCGAGHSMSCWEEFLEVNGLRPLTQMNTELLKFCTDGILAACYARGVNFAEQGHPAEALSSWRGACDKNEAWSCLLASESDGPTISEKAKYREQACRLGLKKACEPADTIGGLSVSVASPTTGTVTQPVCGSGDAEACAFEGTRRAETAPDKYDNAEALDLLKRACLASSTLGCEGYAKSLSK
ncbi:MAG: hypothetical protein H7301_04625 [Cryobacterium sp.]|nr:hypothetical protein [Oligoflexia bacterium]